MKIGVDIRSLEKEPSGVSAYAENLLKNILNIDQTNQYFFFYNALKKPAFDLSSKFPYDNFREITYKIPSKIFSLSQVLLRQPKIDRLVSDLDLFFMPNLNFISFSKKMKTIVTVHDLSFKYFPSFFSAKRRLWHAGTYPKSIFKRARYLVAVSQNTKSDLMKIYNIPSNKIKVIYSGINVTKKPLSDSLKNEIKSKYKIRDRFILSLSNLEPRKNIESIIQSYDLLRDRGYNGQLLIGGKPSWSYSTIFNLAKKSVYHQDINILGYIADADKNYLYQLADIFVYPSYYEGFGFPPLESLVCGTPVITSYNSSLPEIVKNSALLVDPYNLEEIVQAMSLYLNDDKLRKESVEMSQTIADRFSWSKAAQATLELFNTVNQIE